MTTIGVITDAHANLPALEAALAALRDAECDLIVHCGDAIGIGPHPRECLELLRTLPNAHFIMGNHDAWFAYGLPTPRPEWMSVGEFAHQQWTHAQLTDDQRHWVATWLSACRIELPNGMEITFTHYASPDGRGGFASHVNHPAPADLDNLFDQVDSDLVIYGHNHQRSDLQGRARYVNPGALGCSTEPAARIAIVRANSDEPLIISLGAQPYDWSLVFDDLSRRSVPDAETIRRIFFGQS